MKKTEHENLLIRAEAKLNAGQYGGAIDLATEIIKNCSCEMDAIVIIASCFVRKDDLADAAEILRESENIIQSWFRLYECLNEISAKENLFERAKHSYGKFKTLNAGSPVTQLVPNIISSLENSIDNKKSEKAEIDSISSEFHTLTLAELYLQQGYIKMARDLLEKIHDRDPSNIKVQEHLDYIENLISKKRILAIDELERWLKKIQRVKK